MSESFTTDESARRDRLVDAEVREAPRGRWMAFILTALCIACAAATILVTRNGWGTAFLALPIANIMRDFIRGRLGK